MKKLQIAKLVRLSFDAPLRWQFVAKGAAYEALEASEIVARYKERGIKTRLLQVPE